MCAVRTAILPRCKSCQADHDCRSQCITVYYCAVCTAQRAQYLSFVPRCALRSVHYRYCCGATAECGICGIAARAFSTGARAAGRNPACHKPAAASVTPTMACTRKRQRCCCDQHVLVEVELHCCKFLAKKHSGLFWCAGLF